jgi:GntR family transcriptional regulator, rspAB operon transcriptional repressor
MVASRELHKESLSEQIYRALLGRITTLEIAPGERINLERLKEEYSVSTAPIREALQRLTQNGLVTVRPRIGFFALELTKTQVTDIFSSRKVLEIYCLRHSITAIPAGEIEKIQGELRELRAASAPGAPAADSAHDLFERLDLKLHRDLIVAYCPNVIIRSFYDSLSNLSAIIRHMVLRTPADIEEHAAIIDAMGNHDIVHAEEALMVHLSNSEHATLARYSA